MAGAALLAGSLRIEPGDPLFYPATLALAAVWVVGSLSSGPLRLGRAPRPGDVRGPRPILVPVLTGLALAAVFGIGALIVRDIPVLENQVRGVLDFAAEGATPLVLVITLVNGIAEEIFFRGALYEAASRYPIVVTTLLNTAVVLMSGNLMLALAAALLGVVAALARRATGGVLAPVLIHVTWSTAMLIGLPVLIAG